MNKSITINFKYEKNIRNILKIYYVNNLKIFVFGDELLTYPDFYFTNPVKINLWNDIINKIWAFYQILKIVNKSDWNSSILTFFKIIFNNSIFELSWDEMQEDYYYIKLEWQIVKVWYELSSYMWWDYIKPSDLEKELFFSKKEFYLLMQLYYWLYQEEELFKQLKSNEKAWKYDEVKNILNNYTIDWWEFYNWWKLVLDELKNWLKYDENLLEEYLKLELMRKDTLWAFDWLKIEKIYDKDWDKEKQLEVVDKVNKEFWEEVIIYE